MQKTRLCVTVGVVGAAIGGIVSSASATYTVTRGNSAPTYSSTLTFDEPGGPTGMNLPSNAFASAGISALYSGEGSNLVGPIPAYTGQSSNVFYGPYGVFITLAQDATAMSLQFWDTSGSPSPFGGGAAIFLFNDGGADPVAFFGPFAPSLGTNTGSWFDIVATDGMVFDEIRCIGFGFFPESVVDNLSWEPVPSPASLAMFGLVGARLLRRRRA